MDTQRDRSGAETKCDSAAPSLAPDLLGPARARWLACGGGLLVWVACAAFSATVDARIDEHVVGRLMRRWAEHPVRVMAAGTLATWAVGGLVAGAPAAASPRKGGAHDG